MGWPRTRARTIPAAAPRLRETRSPDHELPALGRGGITDATAGNRTHTATDSHTSRRERLSEREQIIMRKFLEIGGFVATAVLIVFGIGAMVLAYQGRNTVQDTLSQQQIVGTPDMTPTLIKQ